MHTYKIRLSTSTVFWRHQTSCRPYFQALCQIQCKSWKNLNDIVQQCTNWNRNWKLHIFKVWFLFLVLLTTLHCWLILCMFFMPICWKTWLLESGNCKNQNFTCLNWDTLCLVFLRNTRHWTVHNAVPRAKFSATWKGIADIIISHLTVDVVDTKTES